MADHHLGKPRERQRNGELRADGQPEQHAAQRDADHCRAELHGDASGRSLHLCPRLAKRGGGRGRWKRFGNGDGAERLRVDGIEQRHIVAERHLGKLRERQRNGELLGDGKSRRHAPNRHADHCRADLHGDADRREFPRAALRAHDALPRGGYPQRRRSLRRAVHRRRRQPRLQRPHQRLRRALHRAGLFPQRGGRPRRTARLSHLVAHRTDATARLYPQLARRPHQIERRHRAGRNRRKHQRVRQQCHRCDPGYQRLLRPRHRHHRPGFLSHHAVPDRRYAQRHGAVGRAVAGRREQPYVPHSVQRVRSSGDGAGLFAELRRGSARPAGVCDGLADRADHAAGRQFERAHGHGHGQCGHRAGGHGGLHRRVRQQSHQPGDRRERLFRAHGHRWVVAVRRDALPGAGHAAAGGISTHHFAGCGGEREPPAGYLRRRRRMY